MQQTPELEEKRSQTRTCVGLALSELSSSSATATWPTISQARSVLLAAGNDQERAASHGKISYGKSRNENDYSVSGITVIHTGESLGS